MIFESALEKDVDSIRSMIFGPSENPLNLEDKFPVKMIKETFVHEYCNEIMQFKNKPSVSNVSSRFFPFLRRSILFLILRPLAFHLDQLCPLKRRDFVILLVFTSMSHGTCCPPLSTIAITEEEEV